MYFNFLPTKYIHIHIFFKQLGGKQRPDQGAVSKRPRLALNEERIDEKRNGQQQQQHQMVDTRQDHLHQTYMADATNAAAAHQQQQQQQRPLQLLQQTGQLQHHVHKVEPQHFIPQQHLLQPHPLVQTLFPPQQPHHQQQQQHHHHRGDLAAAAAAAEAVMTLSTSSSSSSSSSDEAENPLKTPNEYLEILSRQTRKRRKRYQNQMNKYKFEKLNKLRLKLIKKINRINNHKGKEVEVFLKTLKTKIEK